MAGCIAPFFLIECKFHFSTPIVKAFSHPLVPEKVKFLTAREKHIAIKRVSLEKQEGDIEHPTLMQTLSMLMDWKIGV